jgi:hypothetical protein
MALCIWRAPVRAWGALPVALVDDGGTFGKELAAWDRDLDQTVPLAGRDLLVSGLDSQCKRHML